MGASLQVAYLTLPAALSGNNGGNCLGAAYSGEILVGPVSSSIPRSQNHMYSVAGSSWLHTIAVRARPTYHDYPGSGRAQPKAA
jgi:hypothetical protein